MVAAWLPYEVPESAVREPALYLTVEKLPMAVLAPFLHPASSFVNVRGQHSLPTDSPRLAALLERHRGRVRTIGRGLELVDGRPAEARQGCDATMRRFGYRLDATDCFACHGAREPGLAVARGERLAGAQVDRGAFGGELRAAPRGRDPADVERERRASALFDRIEKAAPGCSAARPR